MKSRSGKASTVDLDTDLEEEEEEDCRTPPPLPLLLPSPSALGDELLGMLGMPSSSNCRSRSSSVSGFVRPLVERPTAKAGTTPLPPLPPPEAIPTRLSWKLDSKTMLFRSMLRLASSFSLARDLS